MVVKIVNFGATAEKDNPHIWSKAFHNNNIIIIITYIYIAAFKIQQRLEIKKNKNLPDSTPQKQAEQ